MKNKIQILIFTIIILILSCVCILTYYNFHKSNKNNNTSNKDSDIVNTSGDKEEYNNSNNNDDKNINNETSNIPSTVPIPSNKTSIDIPSNNVDKDVSYTENDVVAYFANIETDIDNNKENMSFKDKAKEKFITIVDFLFYGSKINGYTFNDLTTSAKLKILKIALSIDNKIDRYFPNYKDNIKDKMSDFKGKVASKYLEITSKICEENSDLCITAREDFNNFKNSYNITWNVIKNAVGNGYSYLKTILNEWYQSIKE